MIPKTDEPTVGDVVEQVADMPVSEAVEGAEELAQGLGISISAQQGQKDVQQVATEQATETATAPKEVVGQASAPEASLSTTLVRKFLKQMKGLHNVEPNPEGRTDFTQSLQANPAIAEPQAPLPEQIPDTQLTPDEVAKRVEEVQSYTWSDSDSHQLNFQTMPDTDVTKIVASMADVIASKVDDQRRGKMADEALYEMADILRADPAFMEKVLKMEPGTALAPEEVLAAKQMMYLLGEDIGTMARKFPDMGDAERAEFQERIGTWEAMYSNFMGGRAESGRALRAHGVDPKVGDAAFDIENMAMALAQSQNGVSLEGRAVALSMADDIRGAARIIEATGPNKLQKTFDVAYEVFINGILSGIKTHIVNFTGSSIRTGAHVFDTAVGGLFGGGSNNAAEVIARDEWQAQLFGLTTAWREAFTVAGKTMKSAEKYGDVDKLDSQFHDPAITSENLGGGKAVDMIGSIIRSPTERLMGGTDAFNKYIAEEMSIAGQAWSRTRFQQRNLNLTDDEAEAVLQDLIMNPTEEMKTRAKEDGKIMTFQEDLGPWGKKGQEWIGENRAAKLVVPFFKTPANLLKQGFLERTPLAGFTKTFKEDMQAGGRRRQLALSKMTTGTMMGVGLTTMATQGMITGHYSKDPNIRKAQQEAGWEPMSFVIRDEKGKPTYIPMDRMEPFSYIFGMAADLGALMQDGQMRDLTAEEMDIYTELASTLVVAVGENTINKTFMTGVRQVMDAFTKGGGYAERWVQNTTNAFTPFSGARRNFEQLVKQNRTMEAGVRDYWKERMLVLDSNSAEIVDSLGRTVPLKHRFIPWDFVSPEKSPTALELLRIAKETGRSAIPGTPKKLDGVELTPKQQNRFMKLARTKEFREIMRSAISSKEYKSLYVEDQISYLREITKKFDANAKAMLMQEDKGLMRKVVKHKMQSTARRMSMESGEDPGSLLEKLTDQAMGGGQGTPQSQPQ